MQSAGGISGSALFGFQSALFRLLESHDVIDDLKAQLPNYNADLISELQENITSLEEAAEEASWTYLSQSNEIRRLEGIVDSENISRMEESIDWERSRNCKLCKENCHLSGEVGRLPFQIKDMRAKGETAGVDDYLYDENLSLFPRVVLMMVGVIET